jgi:hypothetical protein
VNILFKKKLHKRLNAEYISIAIVLFSMASTFLVINHLNPSSWYFKHLQTTILETPNEHKNYMILENYGTRLQHLMILSSEHPYNPGYDSMLFDGDERLSFINFPLLVLSILYLLYMRKPKGFFLVFLVLIFLFLTTFLPSVMVVEHLLIMAPITAIMMGSFFEFIAERKRMVSVVLLLAFMVVNSFFIGSALLKKSQITDLTYFYYGIQKLEGETNDIYVVNYNRGLITSYDLFYFATRGKEPKSLCEEWVDCGIEKEILKKVERTKFLFDTYTIDNLRLKGKIEGMKKDNTISLYFDIRNGRGDVIAYVFEKN